MCEISMIEEITMDYAVKVLNNDIAKRDKMIDRLQRENKHYKNSLLKLQNDVIQLLALNELERELRTQ